jgi:hypothetical protein
MFRISLITTSQYIANEGLPRGGMGRGHVDSSGSWLEPGALVSLPWSKPF